MRYSLQSHNRGMQEVRNISNHNRINGAQRNYIKNTLANYGLQIKIEK